jgi:uncharacterized membrane protein
MMALRKRGFQMKKEKATPERLGAFSDGVIAIIITIMVLDLRAPHGSNAEVLFRLWPTFAAYLLSYSFVGIVWVNHHHLLRYTRFAGHLVIWANLAFLFFVSLIPFFTAFMAENQMSKFTTALYAASFLLVASGFMLFQKSITRQMEDDPELRATERGAMRRNWIAMALYALAVPTAYVRPVLSLGLVVATGLLYAIPDLFRVAVMEEPA